MRYRPFIASLLVAAVAALPAFAASPRLAVFDFELIDTSLEGETQGPRADEQQRIADISDQLRRMLAEKGPYEIVDLAPAADAIGKAGLLHGCNGCVTDIAKPLGADLALTGTVQKVSNLILNINVYIWDVASGQQVYGNSVDIRGNTDESWSRGVSYLVRNRLLKALAQLPPQ